MIYHKLHIQQKKTRFLRNESFTPFEHIYNLINLPNRLLASDSCLCGSGSRPSNENLTIL